MSAHKPTTVIGGGLVGSLWSIRLTKLGYAVDVYERRPDMRHEAISAGRSINLAISLRGLHALKQVGLEQEVLKNAIPMLGRMVHPLNGTANFQRYGKNDSECIHSISRGTLNQILMTHAEKNGARFHFRSSAKQYDVKNDRLILECDGKDFEIRPGLLFGTDGSASTIREAIVAESRGKCTEEVLEYGYKELVIPAGPDGSFLLEKNALHIWPRGNYMLIALPNVDGSFTCTLFLAFNGESPCFDSLESASEIREFFSQRFPDALPLMPNLEHDFLSNPTGRMITVRVSPWNSDGRALLLGDAAHAIVPFFGQGMNCGFEDCEILGEMLKGSASTDTVFAEFSRTRKRDSDAIADLALANFVEMRDKVADPRFLMEKAVERILVAKFPEKYVPRYSLVTFSRVPYSTALEAGRIQDQILAELCQGLAKPEDVDLARAQVLIEKGLASANISGKC